MGVCMVPIEREEKRKVCVSIGQYVIHPTRTTDITACDMTSVYVSFQSDNTAPSFQTINNITQLYIYAWNISVVNILGGTDGHGHDNKFKKEGDMPTIIIVSLYVPTQSYITIKHAMSCHTIPHHHPFTTIDSIRFDLIQP